MPTAAARTRFTSASAPWNKAAAAGFVNRLRRQVALHLALIGPEIREEQEQRRDGSRPEGVLLGEVEPKVEHLQAAGGAGNAQRVADPDVIRKTDNQHRDGDQQAG